VGVLLGAFGAHALKAKRSEALLKTWDTAVHYQFIHAIGLLAVAFAPRESRIAGWSFVAGSHTRHTRTHTINECRVSHNDDDDDDV
jgi:uncharacterized membrane protein YgdD (TMEM256/DUF423 family)